MVRSSSSTATVATRATRVSVVVLGALVVPLAFGFAFGCGSSKPSEILTDSGSPDASPTTTTTGTSEGGAVPPPIVDAAPPCFTDAHTNFEIINACTDAQVVDKIPVLPLLNPDGSLPPIP